MCDLWCRFLCAFLLASATAANLSATPSEIVVAIRYLQQTGASHAHLYLYREDGTLLRQLTKDDGGQDHKPVFAPDGEIIVFTRELPKGVKQWWSVAPRGGNLHRLDAAPDWYRQTKDSPHFERLDNDPDTQRLLTSDTGPADNTDPPTYRSPDGQSELVLKVSGEDDSLDLPPHGKSYRLRDLKTGRETELGKLPGFLGLFNLLAYKTDRQSARFLLAPPLRVAFFGLHLGSTDGDTTSALDLDGPRLVPLSPNGATPFPLPGEAAFLTAVQERYVPYGDGKHTANCTYVDRWDNGWKKIRYARAEAPAVCGGASMYRPGKVPAVVTVTDELLSDSFGD